MKIKFSSSRILDKILLMISAIGLLLITVVIYSFQSFNHSMNLFINTNDLNKAEISMNLLDGAFNRIQLNTLMAMTGIFLENVEQVKRNTEEMTDSQNLIIETVNNLSISFPKYKHNFNKVTQLCEDSVANAVELIEKAKLFGASSRFADVENLVAVHVDHAIYMIAVINKKLNDQQTKATIEAKENFETTKWIIICVALLGLIVFTATSIIVSKLNFVNPILKLKAGALKISEGNLEQRIDIRTGDELEELAKQFNLMAQQLSQLYAEQEDKITQRTQELVIANKHKSDFLANMSHELRTPLNAIIGFSEVLQQEMFGSLNEKQQEYNNDIINSGKHLLSLINDILDLSKIEAGKMELNISTFDLDDLIKHSMILITEKAKSNNITLIYNPFPEIEPYMGDERKVKQIMLNLLSNAVKFTPKSGTVTIDVDRKKNCLEISVSDTGIGISPEDQKKVFSEFRQVGTDVTRKAEGTGLGLALTLKFIELHGGRIWLESELGKGTSFIFTLPYTIHAQEQGDIK